MAVGWENTVHLSPGEKSCLPTISLGVRKARFWNFLRGKLRISHFSKGCNRVPYWSCITDGAAAERHQKSVEKM